MILTGEVRCTTQFFSPAVYPVIGSVKHEMGIQFLARASGVNPDQVDRIHQLLYTFVASTPQEIDVLALVGPKIRLATGKILTGADATLAGVTAAPSASVLTFGGAAENPWPVSFPLQAGTTLNHGSFLVSWPGPGLAATAGSKQWLMTPSAHAFTLYLMILGSST